MKWIEISITVEVAVIDEMAAIFNDIESNGYIEETIENKPNLSRVTIYLEAHKLVRLSELKDKVFLIYVNQTNVVINP